MSGCKTIVNLLECYFTCERFVQCQNILKMKERSFSDWRCESQISVYLFTFLCTLFDIRLFWNVGKAFSEKGTVYRNSRSVWCQNILKIKKRIFLHWCSKSQSSVLLFTFISTSFLIRLLWNVSKALSEKGTVYRYSRSVWCENMLKIFTLTQ